MSRTRSGELFEHLQRLTSPLHATQTVGELLRLDQRFEQLGAAAVAGGVAARRGLLARRSAPLTASLFCAHGMANGTYRLRADFNSLVPQGRDDLLALGPRMGGVIVGDDPACLYAGFRQ